MKEITFGDRVKTHRLLRKMTQTALADRAAVSRMTISRIEKGHGGGNVETVRKIAGALRLNINELI